jgi:hypothetical protein
MRTGAGFKGASSRPVRSVKDLLTRHAPQLAQLNARAASQEIFRDWLQLNLPAQLRARITGASETHGTLTVFAESAAWCARLRFALADLEAALKLAHPQVQSVRLRVLPHR